MSDRVGTLIGKFARGVTWRNILRATGLLGLIYFMAYPEKRDPMIIIALCTMMGLPTFFGNDQKPPDRSM